MSKPSKTALAKAEQNFQMKPRHPCCADCQHFTSDFVTMEPGSRWEWTKEANLRCVIGGFKVGKTSVCARFARKKPEAGNV